MSRQVYEIDPVPKPRMTRQDRFRGKPGRLPMRPCVARYMAFAEQVRLLDIKLPESGARVLFIIPMPKSWSRKKQEEMYRKPHQQKPDLSNILKALEDSIYSDDSGIWHYGGLQKRWGYKGKIIITMEERG